MWTISVVLIVLWLLGFISGHTIDGFIHVLLVIAIVVVLIRVIQGKWGSETWAKIMRGKFPPAAVVAVCMGR